MTSLGLLLPPTRSLIARGGSAAASRSRIMHRARCLRRRTEKGRAYGVVTAKALAVLEALLWAFHNGSSGICYPSYEKIAEAAGCARSTVAEAHQGVGGRGRPLMGPADQTGARKVTSDLLDDNGWRCFPRPRRARSFQVRKSGLGP